MKNQRSDHSRRLLYLLDKGKISLRRTDKTKVYGLGVVNGEEVTRKIRV